MNPYLENFGVLISKYEPDLREYVLIGPKEFSLIEDNTRVVKYTPWQVALDSPPINH